MRGAGFDADGGMVPVGAGTQASQLKSSGTHVPLSCDALMPGAGNVSADEGIVYSGPEARKWLAWRAAGQLAAAAGRSLSPEMARN